MARIILTKAEYTKGKEYKLGRELVLMKHGTQNKLEDMRAKKILELIVTVQSIYRGNFSRNTILAKPAQDDSIIHDEEIKIEKNNLEIEKEVIKIEEKIIEKEIIKIEEKIIEKEINLNDENFKINFLKNLSLNLNCNDENIDSLKSKLFSLQYDLVSSINLDSKIEIVNNLKNVLENILLFEERFNEISRLNIEKIDNNFNELKKEINDIEIIIKEEINEEIKEEIKEEEIKEEEMKEEIIKEIIKEEINEIKEEIIKEELIETKEKDIIKEEINEEIKEEIIKEEIIKEEIKKEEIIKEEIKEEIIKSEETMINSRIEKEKEENMIENNENIYETYFNYLEEYNQILENDENINYINIDDDNIIDDSIIEEDFEEMEKIDYKVYNFENYFNDEKIEIDKNESESEKESSEIEEIKKKFKLYEEEKIKDNLLFGDEKMKEFQKTEFRDTDTNYDPDEKTSDDNIERKIFELKRKLTIIPEKSFEKKNSMKSEDSYFKPKTIVKKKNAMNISFSEDTLKPKEFFEISVYEKDEVERELSQLKQKLVKLPIKELFKQQYNVFFLI
jgi:hypothetical protein